ncbi:STAS domain-containing protein [Vibrio sp. SM6]|uniref:STAS domain-containing protein n=1 Tax=Vibrio agarilyticus TaxID=2726741 RepID=A0A7X8YGU9_9VIBR|nr:STAS domain-containing protein [Vibrio agarilyticus]NLS12910.1 STAS domain-containing protein [Vibrio agarilyticus]
MHIECLNQPNDSLLLVVSGDMDASGCSQAQPLIEQLINEHPAVNMTMDLAEVDFLDSSGIGAIVFLFKRLKAQGCTLTLANVHGQPLEIITLLRIDTAIPLTSTAGSPS